MNPKVTVLVPVFNRERFVDDAIRSVIGQDYQDFELLLVDDGSTDGTAHVLESWRTRDARITVVTAPRNLGIPAALNLGLDHARGEYVARLDSDDFMKPRRLAAQVAVLDEKPGVALVSCAYDVVDLAGKHLGTWKGDEPSEVMAFLLHFFNAVGGGGQVMFRLAEVRALGGYALEVPSSEDYDLWVRLLRLGRIETLPFVGMTKRTHSQQAPTIYRDRKRSNWARIMRSSLEPWLDRSVTYAEIDALIALWRADGRTGAAAVAHDVMREAFERFRREHSLDLQTCAKRRIAQRWYATARAFLSDGHPVEAMRYLGYCALWLVG